MPGQAHGGEFANLIARPRTQNIKSCSQWPFITPLSPFCQFPLSAPPPHTHTHIPTYTITCTHFSASPSGFPHTHTNLHKNLHTFFNFAVLKQTTDVPCTLQLKCDGTRWHKGGEVKGKLANRVGSQYYSHYLGTRCIKHYYRWWRTPRLPVVDWTDAPRRFKWTRPFRQKTKSGFCACAITLQTQSNTG